MKFDKIYKRTATGKIQEWQVEVEGNKYRTISGQTDGKKVITEWTVCKGKNIGKKNSTTDEEQALFEAEALRKKKLEKDYAVSLTGVDNIRYTSPMLAAKFEDYESGIKYPVFIQPKLDGIRCIATEESLLTRNGKEIVSCPHIKEPVNSIDVADRKYPLDGELYNHDFAEDFNKIISLVRKTKPTLADINETKQKIQYWVYDWQVSNCNFRRRYQFLQELFLQINPKSWVLVPTYECANREELYSYYEQFIEQGYEGAIVRTDSDYEHKRTKALLKMKEFQDEEFPILDILEGEGNRTGTAGYITTKTKDGKPFRSNIKGDREFVKDLLVNKDKYIGKSSTIKFFRYTPDGIPRFPFVIKIAREDYE